MNLSSQDRATQRLIFWAQAVRGRDILISPARRVIQFTNDPPIIAYNAVWDPKMHQIKKCKLPLPNRATTKKLQHERHSWRKSPWSSRFVPSGNVCKGAWACSRELDAKATARATTLQPTGRWAEQEKPLRCAVQLRPWRRLRLWSFRCSWMLVSVRWSRRGVQICWAGTSFRCILYFTDQSDQAFWAMHVMCIHAHICPQRCTHTSWGGHRIQRAAGNKKPKIQSWDSPYFRLRSWHKVNLVNLPSCASWHEFSKLR